MINEILIILLIIIVLLIFLLFFKAWHIHITFKNNNFEYFSSIGLSLLLFNTSISKDNSITKITFFLKIKNKRMNIFHRDLTYSTEEKKSSDDETDNENMDIDIDKYKSIFIAILDNKEDIYEIFLLLISMITFRKSEAKLNLGLEDNNLTIKVCNFLWALTAPLYPLNFQVILTPEINRFIITSDMLIDFDIKFLNIIKILIIFIRNKNLIDMLKTIGNSNEKEQILST